MINKFSSLFKEIERDIGTRDLSCLVLRSLRDALVAYKGDKIELIYSQMREIVHIINNTEPKFAIIIDNYFSLLEEMSLCVLDADNSNKHDFSSYKKCLIKKIDELISRSFKQWNQLFSHLKKIDVRGKTLLIHDHSHTVHAALKFLKKDGQKFKVIVAEQDVEKTLANIEFLTKLKVPFQTVPDYMLSNVEDEIDMCFFGALTLKNTFDFVTSNGANAVIAQFHLKKKPIYMFLTTSKFSLWKSDKKEVVKRYSHLKKHPFKDIEFNRFKFSHDRVSLENVDFTVTEEGILNATQLKKVYNRKFKEHKVITKKLGQI